MSFRLRPAPPRLRPHACVRPAVCLLRQAANDPALLEALTKLAGASENKMKGALASPEDEPAQRTLVEKALLDIGLRMATGAALSPTCPRT